jgi:GT2 family glycosyltransferase
VSTQRKIVSVVIVTHDSLPAFHDCLESVRKSSSIDSLEVIVVDNASTDGSADTVATAFPDAKVIRNEKNVGFATACNQGAKEAAGDYLAFLNPDVQIDSDSIERLKSVFARNERVGLSAARLRHPGGSFQPTCRKLPTVGNMVFSRGSFLSSFLGRKGKGTAPHYTLPDYGETTAVAAVAATFVMVRRELFNRAGGFDQRFFLFMEDTDLSLRLGYKGYVNLYVPTAGGIHLWGHGGRMGRIRREWHHHMSVWKYFLKHLPNGFSVVILPMLLTLNFFVVCLMVPRKRGGV